MHFAVFPVNVMSRDVTRKPGYLGGHQFAFGKAPDNTQAGEAGRTVPKEGGIGGGQWLLCPGRLC